MHWYLVHTKPKQEVCALQNLEQQGYQCYLPTLASEKMVRGNLTVAEQPLFPRYLFIRQEPEGLPQSWAPIRSTKGVSRLVSFGLEPAKVHNELIDLIRSQQSTAHLQPTRLFTPGERVRLNTGAFASLEGIYQMADGERRAMVLIELMSKPVTISVAPSNIQKIN